MKYDITKLDNIVASTAGRKMLSPQLSLSTKVEKLRKQVINTVCLFSFLCVQSIFRSKSRSVDHGLAAPYDLDSLRSKVEGRFDSVERLSKGLCPFQSYICSVVHESGVHANAATMEPSRAPEVHINERFKVPTCNKNQ